MNVAVVGASRRASFTGLYAFLCSVVMFFGAFTSAMVLRREASNDWAGVPAPDLLWINTGVLALSSGAVEFARRHLRLNDRIRFNFGWTIATFLGLAFLIGQVTVWRHLRAQGVYLNSNPGSAFFYVGTVSHAIHLLGGFMAMLYLNIRALRLQLGPGRRTAVDVTAIYWHFLGILWIYLLWLLRFWGN